MPPDAENTAAPAALTREALQTQHAALFAALQTEFTTAGAEAERARIQAVQAQVIPGHEALVQQLAFDGKTTGPEAAVAVLAAERKVRHTAAADLAADAPAPVRPAAAQAVETPAAAAAQQTPEEQAKAAWDANAVTRAEFGGDYSAYLAFSKASAAGKVRGLSR